MRETLVRLCLIRLVRGSWLGRSMTTLATRPPLPLIFVILQCAGRCVLLATRCCVVHYQQIYFHINSCVYEHTLIYPTLASEQKVRLSARPYINIFFLSMSEVLQLYSNTTERQ